MPVEAPASKQRLPWPDGRKAPEAEAPFPAGLCRQGGQGAQRGGAGSLQPSGRVTPTQRRARASGGTQEPAGSQPTLRPLTQPRALGRHAYQREGKDETQTRKANAQQRRARTGAQFWRHLGTPGPTNRRTRPNPEQPKQSNTEPMHITAEEGTHREAGGTCNQPGTLKYTHERARTLASPLTRTKSHDPRPERRKGTKPLNTRKDTTHTTHLHNRARLRAHGPQQRDQGTQTRTCAGAGDTHQPRRTKRGFGARQNTRFRTTKEQYRMGEPPQRVVRPEWSLWRRMEQHRPAGLGGGEAVATTCWHRAQTRDWTNNWGDRNAGDRRPLPPLQQGPSWPAWFGALLRQRLGPAQRAVIDLWRPCIEEVSNRGWGSSGGGAGSQGGGCQRPLRSARAAPAQPHDLILARRHAE